MRLPRFAPVLSAVALLLAPGCSGIRLAHPIAVHGDDWTTFGRTPARTGALPVFGTFPLEKVWEYDTRAGMAEGGLIAVDSFVIAGTMRGELHLLRIEDGQRLGTTSIGDAVHGTPVIFENCAIFPLSNSGASILSFDLPLGRTRWSLSRGEIESSLLLLNQRLYAGTITGEFLCCDASSGEVLWTFSLPDNRRNMGIRSTPAAWKNVVIVGADDGTLYALDGETGSLRWSRHLDGPVIAPPVVDGHVFVGTLAGTLYAVEPDAGKLLWSAPAAGPISGHALLTDSAAIVGTTNGKMASFRRSDGQLLWSSAAGGPIVAGPVRYADAALAGTLRRELVAFRCRDGEILWRQGVEGRVRTAPLVVHGMVLVATDQQALWAFRGGRGK